MISLLVYAGRRHYQYMGEERCLSDFFLAIRTKACRSRILPSVLTSWTSQRAAGTKKRLASEQEFPAWYIRDDVLFVSFGFSVLFLKHLSIVLSRVEIPHSTTQNSVLVAMQELPSDKNSNCFLNTVVDPKLPKMMANTKVETIVGSICPTFGEKNLK